MKNDVMFESSLHNAAPDMLAALILVMDRILPRIRYSGHNAVDREIYEACRAVRDAIDEALGR